MAAVAAISFNLKPEVMKNIIVSLFLFIAFLVNCKDNKESQTEKFQRHRDNIVDMSNKVVDIDPKIIIGRSFMKIIGDYLIVTEYDGFDRGIHLFDKNTFEYLTSTGIIGRGPGEITRNGFLVPGYDNRSFWASDPANNVMWKFSLDSIFNNPKYKPAKKLRLHDDLYLTRFDFVNDSIALGKAMHILSVNSFDMAMAKLNIHAGTTQRFGYEHPEATGRKSNSFFALSPEKNFYVNVFAYLDLITICNLDGTLKCNILGPEWGKKYKEPMAYFSHVIFMGDNIIADYVGGPRMVYDKNGAPLHGSFPSKFIVFDMEGNYKQTYEVGSQFSDFCVDQENNRIIIFFWDRLNQMGYLDLNTIEL
jgi:hypothetical protein